MNELGDDVETLGDDVETIVAISTAVGLGAIGIVRLSGPEAIGYAERAFRSAARAASVTAGDLQHPGRRPATTDTHRLLYGHIVDPESGSMIDEVLLAVMRKPRTYTREDVVEVHCHGGVAAQRAVLRVFMRLGARLAQPGEFTRRAFLNGRIDLAQAESVAAIIRARSSGALRASMRQLEGGLSQKVKAIRRELVGVLSRIEATVDFSDEDVEEFGWADIAEELEGVHVSLGRLLDTAFVGRALEEGLRTAIVGKPNVGKSSLLNALLMRERAIVSDLPGTTRDTVEELMEIGGIPIHLVDTAGLRSGGDHVEQQGVARTLKAMEQADVVIAVLDLSAEWDDADRQLISELDRTRSIVVANKKDLVPEAGWEERLLSFLYAVDRGAVDENASARRWCAVSAATGEGLGTLRAYIQSLVTQGTNCSWKSRSWPTNVSGSWWPTR